MHEAEHRFTKEETIDQKPFVIRAHHLENYIDLTDDIHLIFKNLVIRYVAKQLLSIMEPSERQRRYMKDRWGSSFRQFSSHEKLYSETIKQFQKLPDNHPVELTEGIPDVICKICVIGQHCRTLETDADLRIDRIYIDEFLKDVNRINSETLEATLSPPIIKLEMAYFLNSPPQEVRRVETKAYVVRKVLKEGKSPFFWHRGKRM